MVVIEIWGGLNLERRDRVRQIFKQPAVVWAFEVRDFDSNVVIRSVARKSIRLNEFLDLYSYLRHRD